MHSFNATLAIPEQLDNYFQQIDRIIIAKQHPITGLFPASTAVNSHGNYTDAWVRDNVYALQAVWGLALAYRKAGCDSGRARLLEQTTIKTMRGLLIAMMKQSDKVERFKRTREVKDSLHAKYDTATGDTVVADHAWGHLQLDATSIFMLMLAQMTRSGLQIVSTMDEVNFVQNLVYYLARAYRIRDFGIWERGNKINNGRAEINASSVGMVKAALQSLQGLNLFGHDRYEAAVIHVNNDEIAQCSITLQSLLPRESNSKEVDAALLSIISYPAFAVEDVNLVNKTRNSVLQKLGGHYGCKRFLLDGHQTVLEDTSRLHYEYNELKKFAGIESEWPLFFTYLLLDALFRHDYVEASHYRNRLRKISVIVDGMECLPELYYVPADKVEAERKAPGSQTRISNDNVPLIWAQSLYYLGCLISDGLLTLADIDPLHRHRAVGRKKNLQVQIALLAEDKATQTRLTELGYDSELLSEVSDILVKDSRELARVYTYIGSNEKLQLTGRPMRRMRSLMTAQIYRIKEDLVVFLPQFQNQSAFYISLDNHILVEQLTVELYYLVKHWNQPGKPLVTLLLNRNMLSSANDSQPLLDFLSQAKLGKFESINLCLGFLSDFIRYAGHENLQNVNDFAFLDVAMIIKPITNYLTFDIGSLHPVRRASPEFLKPTESTEDLIKGLQADANLYQQIDILTKLVNTTSGLDFAIPFTVEGKQKKQNVTLRKLVEEVYRKACEHRLWGIIRTAAGLLDKYNDRLDVVTQELIIRQKQVVVGRSYHSATTIDEILTSREIHNKILTHCGNDVREAQINQEILYYLGLLIKADPDLFSGIVTVNTGHLLLLCIDSYAKEFQLQEDEAFARFTELSPHQIQNRLQVLLRQYHQTVSELTELEALQYVKPNSNLVFVNFADKQSLLTNDAEEVTDWLEWRKQSGAILHMPDQFYEKFWALLGRCPGVVIGDRYNSQSRLETAYIQGAMTPGERSFALLVDNMLRVIPAPEYRYLTIESIMVLAAFIQVNPGLQFNDYLILDMLIEHAVRLDWLEHNQDNAEARNVDNVEIWRRFYLHEPYYIAAAINRALEHLLTETGEQGLRTSMLTSQSKIA